MRLIEYLLIQGVKAIVFHKRAICNSFSFDLDYLNYTVTRRMEKRVFGLSTALRIEHMVHYNSLPKTLNLSRTEVEHM